MPLAYFSSRKYQGRISTVTAFCLLLGQKFMSIVISKLFLNGELPTLHDSNLLILLGVHFLTFTLFHMHTGDEFMTKIKNNEYRILAQETFKGYGKGHNLLKLVEKGIKLHQSAPCFVLFLFIRGSASALFKATCMSFLLKKPVKTEKAKINLIFITIPTVFYFLFKHFI
jgi:hypothetical protein